MKKMVLALVLGCFLSAPVQAEELTISDGPWTYNMFDNTMSKEITVEPIGDYILFDDQYGFYGNSIAVLDGHGTISFRARDPEKDFNITLLGGFKGEEISDYDYTSGDVIVENVEKNSDGSISGCDLKQELTFRDNIDGVIFYSVKYIEQDEEIEIALNRASVVDGVATINAYLYNIQDNITDTQGFGIEYEMLIPCEGGGDLSSISCSDYTFETQEKEKDNAIKYEYSGSIYLSSADPEHPVNGVAKLSVTKDGVFDRHVLRTMLIGKSSFGITEEIPDLETYPDYSVELVDFTPLDYSLDIHYDNSEGYVLPPMTFDELYEAVGEGHSDIKFGKDGSFLFYDTNESDSEGSRHTEEDDKSEDNMAYLRQIHELLGLPEVLDYKMFITHDGAGLQTETYGDIKVTWSYATGRGLEVIYEKIE